MTGKGEDQQRSPPGVAASPPPAQHGSPRVVASGPDPERAAAPAACHLWQCAPHEDDRHLKAQESSLEQHLTGSSGAKQMMQHLCTSPLAAPATAAGSHQALERQGVREGLGAETPQAKHGMPVGTLVGHGAGYSPTQTTALHQHVASKTLPSLLNTAVTQATTGLHTKTRQL